MTTLFAAVRFSPVPPAMVEMRNTNMSGSSWNWSINAMPDITHPCHVSEHTARLR